MYNAHLEKKRTLALLSAFVIELPYMVVFIGDLILLSTHSEQYCRCTILLSYFSIYNTPHHWEMFLIEHDCLFLKFTI